MAEIDWGKEMWLASKQLNRNKAAIDSTKFGTPAAWSRPINDQPLVTPDKSAPIVKVKTKKLTKKQRKAHNKTFIPNQKKKSRESNENGGLPIVRKSNP